MEMAHTVLGLASDGSSLLAGSHIPPVRGAMAGRPMKPERWPELPARFHEAVELGPEEQRAYLEELRRRDRELGDALARLLAADADPAPVLDGGADQLLEDDAAALLEEDVGARLRDALAEDAGGVDGSAPDHPPDPLLGTNVGPFRLERRIGIGGMGALECLPCADS